MSLISVPFPLNRLARWPDGVRAPDFIGIGAPKSATTWLHAQLRTHPDVRLPGRKEVNYFSNNHRRPLKWYVDEFPSGGITGEFSPNYCVLPTGRIRWMRRVLPDVRLILTLRHPLDRAWSHARMKLRADYGLDRMDSGLAEEIMLSRPAIERSDYARILERFSAVYGRDRIGVFYYESLMDSPASLLEGVSRFLGLDPGAWAAGTGRERVLRTKIADPAPSSLGNRVQHVYSRLWEDAVTTLGPDARVMWPEPLPLAWARMGGGSGHASPGPQPNSR